MALRQNSSANMGFAVSVVTPVYRHLTGPLGPNVNPHPKQPGSLTPPPAVPKQLGGGGAADGSNTLAPSRVSWGGGARAGGKGVGPPPSLQSRSGGHPVWTAASPQSESFSAPAQSARDEKLYRQSRHKMKIVGTFGGKDLSRLLKTFGAKCQKERPHSAQTRGPPSSRLEGHPQLKKNLAVSLPNTMQHRHIGQGARGLAVMFPGRSIPGRYFTFSCRALMPSPRATPSTTSGYAHRRTSESNSFSGRTLFAMILQMAVPQAPAPTTETRSVDRSPIPAEGRAIVVTHAVRSAIHFPATDSGAG